MNQKLVVFAVLVVTVLSAHAADKVVLTFDDDYAPYSFVGKGQLKGIYPDLIRKAALKLAPTYEVVLRPRPWKRALAEVESGEAMGVVPPYLVKDRTYISPYSTALARESVVLYCNEEVMKSPRKKFPDDFAGLVIGVNAGFVLSDALSAAVNGGKVKLNEAKGNDANLKMLASKRVGCYANDRESVAYSLSQMKSDPSVAGLKLTEAVELTGQDAYIGYSAKASAPFKADFIQKMNKALEELKGAGEVAKIAASYK